MRAGWALAYRRYSDDYAGIEAVARARGAGLWGLVFVPPWTLAAPGWTEARLAELGSDRYRQPARLYLHSYAREMAWREDNRREPNGTLYAMVASAALAHPVSRQWKGYWQRSAD